MLKVAEQSINSFISLALAIIDIEIVAKQLLGLANMASAKILYIYELMWVFMIEQNQDLIFAVFKVVVATFKYFDNS